MRSHQGDNNVSLLSREQRTVIRADTKINPILIDRVVDAFDALINRGDVDAYNVHMRTAYAQQGVPLPIPAHERPCAVDKIKTICIKAYSDELHISFKAAATRLRKMLGTDA